MPGPGMKRGGPGGHRFQKPKNVKKTVLRLFGYLSKRKWLLILVVVMVLLSTLGMVSASYFIRVIVDDYLQPMLTAGPENADFGPLIHMLLRMAVLFALSAAASYGYARIMLILSQSTVNIIRRDLFDAMQDLPISYFDTHTHGELMSRYTNDVDTVRNFLSMGFVQTISSLVSVVATFGMMLFLSFRLTVLMLVAIAVMLVIIKKMGGKSSRYFRAQQKALGAANGFIEETIEGQKVVKVFNHEQKSIEAFSVLNDELQNAATSANTYASALMPIMGNFSHVVYAAIAAAGGVFVIGNTLSVGTVLSFLQYTRSFTQPLTNLSQQFNNILSALAGAERIFDVIDQKPETDDGYVTLVNAKYTENGELIECPEHTGLWAWKHKHTADGSVTYKKLEGDVEFEHVTFSYDGKKTVLNDISLYAKPGQKIAFVGSTGAGKTTITNLLNRFYEIQDGKIRYDGINIQKIKKADLRRSLAMVLQDTHLFTGTVEDNIRYGNLDATHEQIVEAAKLANADDFITRLPQGYDTVITGDGANLSQGQRQLLAIARAAVADPPVLVLDEATSSIDTRTEHLIEQGMDKLMQGRTVFVIAHRLSTVRNADAIMVLEHGEIIERGDHDDLLRQKGKYYQLYTGQFELT
ncbi:MAG TPA: ABC transporter ATP-binding protein [Candidatus Fimenecus excrementavium]|nr:ABC transporter ATP-binding protein [Candidatus Fimenecus excrementavium]